MARQHGGMNTRNYARIASALVLGLGLVLLVFMVTVESEPGALPLGLVLLGSIGLFATRRKRQAE
jgi:LPXTG-motif cell wall-anchored protein